MAQYNEKRRRPQGTGTRYREPDYTRDQMSEEEERARRAERRRRRREQERIRAERQRNRVIFISVLVVIFILAVIIGYVVGSREVNSAGTAFVSAGNFFKTRILSYSSAYLRMLY
jgi:cell division septal protein FtsQ